MKLLKFWTFAVIIIAALGLAACGGGEAEVKTQHYSTTLGQELKDLEDAYNKGSLPKNNTKMQKKN
jgi:uncharacterized lipoprotein YmbA